MKYAFWGFGVIAAGLAGIMFIFMFQSITTNDESEYYVLKEAMEAAMIESVDLWCYSIPENGCGEVIKISEQKFVENFTRRFVENISGDAQSYELMFYDIIEKPPKATVVVKGKTKSFSIMAGETSDGSFKISNALSGILEYDPQKINNRVPLPPETDSSDIDINLEDEEAVIGTYNPDAGKSDEEIEQEKTGETFDSHEEGKPTDSTIEEIPVVEEETNLTEDTSQDDNEASQE